MERYTVGETYGSSDYESSYVISGDCVVGTVPRNRKKSQSFAIFIRSVFLPQGYPNSVSADYMEYQLWDTIQAFSSSITGSLATQAVLKGVGVGDESATVMAATVTWLLKDGTGMIGRILFAWLQGSYLDCNCKQWRLFADVLNDVAIFLDILASYFTNIFRVIVCISGVFRAVVGVAGGATRAAITQHQARRNNMADVSAKDGSQETLVNLMGLICSLFLIPLVSGKMSVWLLFMIFTFLHLAANYRAVTCVVMETFNQSRLHIASKEFFSTGVCPSIFEANFHEPVLFNLRRNFKINLGCSLQKFMTRKKTGTSTRLTGMINSQCYILHLDLEQYIINISLHVDSSMLDQLKSCFHAELIEFCFKHSFQNRKVQETSLDYLVFLCNKGNVTEILLKTQEYVEKHWNRFTDAVVNSGWKTSPVLLGADEWRIRC